MMRRAAAIARYRRELHKLPVILARPSRARETQQKAAPGLLARHARRTTLDHAVPATQIRAANPALPSLRRTNSFARQNQTQAHPQGFELPAGASSPSAL